MEFQFINFTPKYLNVEKRQKLTSGNQGPNNNMKETILTMYQALMNHLNNWLEIH